MKDDDVGIISAGIAFLASLIFTVWFIYLLFKIAQHVEAWPFG